MKIRKCTYKGCVQQRMKRPGNTSLYFKFCKEHQVRSILDKMEEDYIRNRLEIAKLRKTGKKTAVERFYSSTAWRWCSRYVLLYYADSDLMVKCSTSTHLIYRVTSKNIHCGHYIKSDQHKATAFEFKNLFPQSYSDNVHFSGKPEIAKEWIEKIHGAGTVEWLEKKKNETYHLDSTELDKWAKYYRTLFNELLIERNIKNPWK